MILNIATNSSHDILQHLLRMAARYNAGDFQVSFKAQFHADNRLPDGQPGTKEIGGNGFTTHVKTHIHQWVQKHDNYLYKTTQRPATFHVSKSLPSLVVKL